VKKGRKTNGSGWQGLGVQSLTPTELDNIHGATLKVLQHTGIRVYSLDALKIFASGGADVDFHSGLVRIPPYMVEESIESAPSCFILAGRTPEDDVFIGGRRVHFTTFGAGSKVLDHQTGKLSHATKSDLGEAALVADALSNVDIFTTTVTATDMPVDLGGLHEAEAFLLNTSKHCQHCHLKDGFEARLFFEMAAVITGGWDKLRERPIVSTMICPSSPLQLHRGNAEIIIESARAFVPVNILPMVMAGATAPVTLAGTMVVHNAEVLGGIVLHQLVNRGAPIIYGGSSTIFDMYTLTAPVGAPEVGMLSAAAAEMAHFYLLPSYVGGT